MKVKYVVFGEMYAVLLPSSVAHADVELFGKPTSAGFCSFARNQKTGNFEANVWGESVSLKLASNPMDVIAIQFLLNN